MLDADTDEVVWDFSIVNLLSRKGFCVADCRPLTHDGLELGVVHGIPLRVVLNENAPAPTAPLFR